mmetsp:Transcript_32326/g.32642  ORF Transcript_32326/g.32642 Transcript_32326/m.32642 type:complete len:83 (-) Transcript_32326:295-543(-)
MGWGKIRRQRASHDGDIRDDDDGECLMSHFQQVRDVLLVEKITPCLSIPLKIQNLDTKRRTGFIRQARPRRYRHRAMLNRPN